MTVAVRRGRPGDHAQLAALYAAAFPTEHLLPLVDAVLISDDCLASLVAVEGASVVGHVLLTMCSVTPDAGQLALLGPLALLPAFQRRGIGTKLVKKALRQLAAAAISRIFVLGDPAYYGRFGFASEGEVEPAMPIPPAWQTAWQSLSCPVRALFVLVSSPCRRRGATLPFGHREAHDGGPTIRSGSGSPPRRRAFRTRVRSQVLGGRRRCPCRVRAHGAGPIGRHCRSPHPDEDGGCTGHGRDHQGRAALPPCGNCHR